MVINRNETKMEHAEKIVKELDKVEFVYRGEKRLGVVFKNKNDEKRIYTIDTYGHPDIYELGDVTNITWKGRVSTCSRSDAMVLVNEYLYNAPLSELVELIKRDSRYAVVRDVSDEFLSCIAAVKRESPVKFNIVGRFEKYENGETAIQDILKGSDGKCYLKDHTDRRTREINPASLWKQIVDEGYLGMWREKTK